MDNTTLLDNSLKEISTTDDILYNVMEQACMSGLDLKKNTLELLIKRL